MGPSFGRTRARDPSTPPPRSTTSSRTSNVDSRRSSPRWASPRCCQLPRPRCADSRGNSRGRSRRSPNSSSGEVLPPRPSPRRRSSGARTSTTTPSATRASITEPEAVMMLATSVKRWEPSYNADLTVTRHALIVNQFLTKAPTDYHHFRRALPTVLATLGRPEAWVGDGHYSTQENLLLAHRAGVVLYAPLPDSGDHDAPAPPTAAPHSAAEAPVTSTGPARKFCSRDFRHDSEKDMLICPAGEELRLIG